MLHSVTQLEGRALGATDGPIGKVKDFYFDDQAWVVRYVVVDTTTWLGGREVLISPYSMDHVRHPEGTLPATVTKEQVRNSPGIDTDRPISRQYEKSYLGYYGYPCYWGGPGLWGEGNYPGTLGTDAGTDPRRGPEGSLRAPTHREADTDPHLRSCNAVKGYHILAKDGEIGHVQGFLMEDSTWSIRYLIVNTSNWWMGHQVLISPAWIRDVNWSESVVSVDLDRQLIQAAPAYDPAAPPVADAEEAIEPRAVVRYAAACTTASNTG